MVRSPRWVREASLWAGAAVLAGASHADEASVRARVQREASTPGPSSTESAGFSRRADRDKITSKGQAWYQLESGPVAFGDLLPGEPVDLLGGIRVRVFADGPWALRVVPRGDLAPIGEAGVRADHSRLAWRAEQVGGFVALGSGAPVIVATGIATGPQGYLVVVDLRATLDDYDALGVYECQLDLSLEGEFGPARAPERVVSMSMKQFGHEPKGERE